ncbi:MAG: hypothetical protein ACYSWU_05170 [Planctomycetota bacterium]
MVQKLTPPVLAKRWGIGHEKVLQFIRAGELRALDLASPDSTRPRYRIDVADVAAFEQARTVAAGK